MTTHWPIFTLIKNRIEAYKNKSENEKYWDYEVFVVQELEELIHEIQSLEPVWIPVTERLPEFGTDVLVLSRSFHYDAYRTRSENWLINSTFHSEEAIANDVTHWMPLPLAPNE